jgi:hypothetical protein
LVGQSHLLQTVFDEDRPLLVRERLGLAAHGRVKNRLACAAAVRVLG